MKPSRWWGVPAGCTVAALCAAAGPQPASAPAATPPVRTAPWSGAQLLDRLLACDDGFFRYLAAHRQALAPLAGVDAAGTAPTFRVADRDDDNGAFVRFRRPLPAGGVRLLGYVDRHADLGALGETYAWGLVADVAPAALAARVKRALPQPQRMQYDADEAVYRQIDRRESGGSWRKVADPLAPRDQAVGTAAVERSLTVGSPVAGQGAGVGRSYVECALQGGVDSELLRQTRPDLNK